MMEMDREVKEERRKSEFQLARRGTYLKISLDRILENLKLMKCKIAPHTKIIAVMKGNAYGHGSVPVAKCLENHGYSHFAVATAFEGEQLRNGGIVGFIQVLGTACAEEIPTLYHSRLTPTVSNTEFLLAWVQYFKTKTESTPESQEAPPGGVVIKVDTGMSRHGCQPNDLQTLVQLCRNNDISIHSLMTHFVQPWDALDFTRGQLNLFLETVEPYRMSGVKLQVANSGAVANSIGTDLDFVRMGIVIFGQAQDTDDNSRAMVRMLGVKPTVEWFAKATLVKDLKKGQVVGYDQAYRCSQAETIAVVPLGYVDGFRRSNVSKAILTTADGTKCPVIGRISMDAITVKLPDDTKTSREFCVMSADDNDINSCCAIARNTSTNQYEVYTSLHVRLPRLYELNGKICHVQR